MSKQQATQRDDQGTAQRTEEKQRADDLPATAMVRQLLATGNPDPTAIAEIVVANPHALHEIVTFLNRTIGNRFASHVVSLATQDVQIAPPGDYEEMRRAMHDAAPDKESTEALGMNASNLEVAPPNDLDTMKQAMQEAAPDEPALGEPRELESFDRSGEYMESRTTVEGPTEQHASTWVTKARHYNKAHADNVSLFLQATGTQCVDEATGEADPKRIARWQADHGIPPDGRIGDQTVTAAMIDAS